MDQDDEVHEQRRRQKAASKQPMRKYAEMMQKLADRSIDEVLIELDDLVTVSPLAYILPRKFHLLTQDEVRERHE